MKAFHCLKERLWEKSMHGAAALCMAVLIAAGSSFAATYTVTSPNGSIVVTINETPTFQYMVTKGGKTAIAWSPLGITFNTMAFTTGIVFVSQATTVVNETYNPINGVKSSYRNYCNQLTLNLRNAANNQFALVFRAYNEGIAFRYVVQGTGNATATSEASAFNLPTGTVSWTGAQHTEYQGLWSYNSTSPSGTFQAPMLMRTLDTIYVLISESAVYGTFTGCDLRVNAFSVTFAYKSQPTCALPLTTMPWRYALVGTLANVIENGVMMTDNLNPPNEITDVSWIKPGRVAWSWLTEGVSNLTQQRAYVDFAKSMGWEYILVDEGWRSTSPATLIPYAATQGVGIILWFNYSEVTTQATWNAAMDQAIAYGPAFKGMKVDFVVNWDQPHMQWYDNIIQAAAAKKLLIYFHGCMNPRGQNRRWPNYMTAEGIYGAEQDMSAPRVPLVHKCIIPYTRNIAAMDYTPTLLSKTTNSSYASEIAQSVVFYSALQHLCDNPTSYNSFTPSVVQFLKDVPVIWDDVKFLAGDVGNYCCIARRKGNDWWLVGINNGTRTVNLDLSFMKAGSYPVSLYSDVSATARTMQMTTVTLTAPGTRSIMMANGGGFAVRVPNSYQAVSVRGNSEQVQPAGKEPGISIVRSSGGYRIHADGTTRCSYRVLTISGQTIALGKNQRGTWWIPASSLRPGTYLIQATADNYSVVKKFICK
jgi:alpha-glucosidase